MQPINFFLGGHTHIFLSILAIGCANIDGEKSPLRLDGNVGLANFRGWFPAIQPLGETIQDAAHASRAMVAAARRTNLRRVVLRDRRVRFALDPDFTTPHGLCANGLLLANC